MDQLRRLFDSLTVKQRFEIGAAALAVCLALWAVAHWSEERDFKPLYTDLAPDDGGAVVAKIRETGTPYRLTANGGTILVPSSKVAELRLQLASAGIPKSGRIGFEIFDKTNFGASDFTEQVNYHRAIEGELERSVMSIMGVTGARVHVTFPKDSIFTDNQKPAKASVLVGLKPGVRLSPANVQAICQLASSAVEGLAPEAVSVLDMRGNLLSHPRASASADDSAASPAIMEYRQAVEKDLMQKIAFTLDPLVGEGKFRTGVSADCDLSSGDESEESFDPSKSVMTSSQKTEDVSGGALAAGVPGTASNLPRPVARPSGGRSGVSRRSETIAYETSRTVRHTRLPQGALKRLSVSVLVDYDIRWQGEGAKAKRIVSPPSPERLKSIHDLVAAAIGFDARRGDQLVIESLPFESTLNPSPALDIPSAPPPSAVETFLRNRTNLYIAGGAAALLLLLGVGAMAVLRKRSRKAGSATMRAQIPGAAGEAGTHQEVAVVDLNAQIQHRLSEQKELLEKQAQEALNSLKLSKVNTKKTDALSHHISEEAKKDPAVMARVLQTWLAETES